MSDQTQAETGGGIALSLRAHAMADAARAILAGDNERSLAQRSALFAFSIRVGAAAVAYLSQILLARWMGAFEYGVFIFVWVWVIILGGMTTLGFNTSAQRFLSAYRENGEGDLMRGMLMGGRFYGVIASTGVAALGMAGLWAFGDMIASYYVLPAYLILVCLPIFTLTDIQDGMSRVWSWIDLALIPPYLVRPFLILAFMGGAVLWGAPATAVTAAACAIAASWLTGIVQFIVFQKRISKKVKPGPRATRTGPWIAASLPILLVEGFDTLMAHTDILVLSLYHSPAEVAVYFAAVKTMALISFIHFALAAASASKFASLWAVGDKQKLSDFARDVVNWCFWPSLAAAVLLLIMGKPLLSLFGPEFAAGYPVMFVFVIGLLARSAVGPIEYLLNMVGEQKATAMVLGGSYAANLGLNFMLIPVFGLMGAAAATAASITISAAILMLIARWRIGINVFIWRRG